MAVHCACTVRALCVHCQNTQVEVGNIQDLCRSQEWQEKIERDCEIAGGTCLRLCLWIGSGGCEESRKFSIIANLVHNYISKSTCVHTYIHPSIHTCKHAYMHMRQAFHATEQLSQKTRRQDFCRRLMEKILHHQTHLEPWPSCSPFNIGRKYLSQKQRSWMTEILHQRAMLENTTLNRGCGGRSHTVLSNMPAPVQDFFHQQYLSHETRKYILLCEKKQTSTKPTLI